MYYQGVAEAHALDSSSDAPAVLWLGGHPVRWRLLRELAESDLRVRELTARLGERQSLVSYHLGLLRQVGLVAMRQSAADRRDSYYALDLPRFGELLSEAATVLHPGLRLARRPDVLPDTVAGRVLFLCTGNGARSQMAEALMQEFTQHRVEAFSAGSSPTRLHPNAVRVMRAYGIDIAGRRAKHLGQFVDQRFDCVVTVCDRVREVCPEFPGAARWMHWSIADPADSDAGNAATYPAFERAAAELAVRIPLLVQSLAGDAAEATSAPAASTEARR